MVDRTGDVAGRTGVERPPLAGRRTGWMREMRATLALGLPLIAAQLAQIAINATDTLMIGQLGEEALAAGALGTTLTFMHIIAGIGLSVAVGALVAQERGNRPSAVRGPRRTFRQGIWAVTLWSVPSMIILWNGEAVLLFLRQDPGTAAYADEYLKAALWSVPFALWFVVLRAFVSSLERPWPILVITCMGIAANALVNWVLMFGHWGAPALGIAGTGIATTVVNAGMLAALGAYCAWERRLRRYRLAGRLWRADWPRLAQIFRMGLPISGLLIAEVGSFAATTLIAGTIDTATLAAHTVALQVASVAFMVPLGLSQATTVRAGLAYGRGYGVGRAGSVSLVLAVGFAAATAIVLFAVPEALVGAFIDKDAAAEASALAVQFLFLAAVFQLSDSGQVIYAAALRGIGDTAVPLVLGLVGYWVIGIPLGAALAYGWLGVTLGGMGVWIGLATGLTVVFVLLGWRWYRELARMRTERHGEIRQ